MKLTFKDFLESDIKKNTNSLNLLSENPVAYEGDLNYDLAYDLITARVMDIKWDKRGTIQTKKKDTLDVFKLKNALTYVVGSFEPSGEPIEIGVSEFAVFAEIKLKKETIQGVDYHSVVVVKVSDGKQGRGIGTALYKFLVMDGLQLLSDQAQFFGARKLWTNLSISATVDVIDDITGKTLYKNITLKSSKLDKDIDTRVWSYVDQENQDYSKSNIRFVLKSLE